MNFDALKFAAFNAAQTLWHGISYKSVAAAIIIKKESLIMLTEHFSESEFACRHCGQLPVAGGVVVVLVKEKL